MTIEILYPELCNLYGDRGNMQYLRHCVEAEFIETGLTDTPYFATHKVDMVYLGSMTEKSQQRIIDRLRPYTARLQEMVEQDVVFLLTGNAMEVFGRCIETESGDQIEALGLFDVSAKRIIPQRANSLFVGTFQEQQIVGYVSRFGHLSGVTEKNRLFKVEKGLGSSPDCPWEGFHTHHVFATYLLGPLLVLNPDFTRYLLGLLGVKEAQIAFPDAVERAYRLRLEEYRRNIVFGEHK
ncbi:MAG: hypothetical protein Q3985_00015 [Eubacteriales bacterium]|nr:hypothetical protein [Eubacteriales bacterium]